jgi:hypothetical protein
MLQMNKEYKRGTIFIKKKNTSSYRWEWTKEREEGHHELLLKMNKTERKKTPLTTTENE